MNPFTEVNLAHIECKHKDIYVGHMRVMFMLQQWACFIKKKNVAYK